VQVDSKQRMNVLLYHSKRKDHVTSATSLAAYSVVITSYTMLANECGSIVTKKGEAECIDLASDDEGVFLMVY
jgi:SNF2-related domain